MGCSPFVSNGREKETAVVVHILMGYSPKVHMPRPDLPSTGFSSIPRRIAATSPNFGRFGDVARIWAIWRDFGQFRAIGTTGRAGPRRN
eukprot:386786-Pyramimonas_sp.AAC.3